MLLPQSYENTLHSIESDRFNARV